MDCRQNRLVDDNGMLAVYHRTLIDDVVVLAVAVQAQQDQYASTTDV